MPIGLRGVGKTVLLNRFCEIGEQEGLAVAYIEASEKGEFSSQLAIRLRKILLQMDRGPVSSAVVKALQVLKGFTLTLPEGGSIRLDPQPLPGSADSGFLDEDLADLLVEAGRAMADRRSGLLIAVDEVQYLSSEELAAAIVAIHRTTQLDLPVVLVGAGLPQLPGIAGEAKSYAERLFDFPEIGPLEVDEAKDVLAIPAENEAVTITPSALSTMASESSGYPYFLQEWGHHCWNVATGNTIDDDDVAAGRLLVQSALDANFFRVRLDRLTPMERMYLRAMAALESGPHRSGDIAAKLGVKVESVAPRRSGLIKKGMIYSPAHGDTAFTVPLFDDFLCRTLPDDTRP